MDQGQTVAYALLSVAQREQIITENLPMVRQIVARLQTEGLVGLGIEAADLIQEGAVALVTSLNRYKTGYGAQFRTFAYWRVYGRIIDYIRDQSPAPRTASLRRRQFHVIELKYEEFHGRRPTSQEIMDELKLTPRQFERAKQQIAALEPMVRLDATGQNNREEDCFAGNRLTEFCVLVPSLSVEDLVIRGEESDRINAALAHLPARTQRAITARFREERRQREIARDLRVSPSTIHKDTAEGLGQLRKLLANPASDQNNPPSQAA